MNKIKNCLVLVLVLSVLLSLGACGRKKTGGYYVDESDISDSSFGDGQGGDSNENGDDGTGGNTNTNSANSGAGNSGTANASKDTDRSSETLWKIKRNVTPQASSSIMKNLNFKGEELRMLVYQAIYTKYDEKIISDFQSTYNCKIKVDIVDYETYPDVLSTSLASGKPYNIVRLHHGFFPQVAVAKLAQPLEKAISKEDLTTSSNKTGINWDATLSSASWNNHIFYVLDHRVGPLQILLYNKALFKQYGLEDALELYKSGKWTIAKMEEYAKIVSSSGGKVKFYNDTVSSALAAVNNRSGFYEIANDGNVKWLGANSKLLNYYTEEQRLRALSPLDALSATIDTMTTGQCMVHFIEAEKLSVYENSLKSSQAFGKSLSNVGVVPIPLSDSGKYKTAGAEGYMASRGCDPKAAVAMSIFYSKQPAAWEGSNIPALNDNKQTFYDVYNTFDYNSNLYVFRSADGKKADELIYSLYGEIDKGGDIMKLLQDYAPTVKTAVEYTLSNQ